MDKYDELKPVTMHYQPLSKSVEDQIINLIMEGKLKAGEKISPEFLAQNFGVSRTPVREALKHLEKIGLVVSKPYVGTYVKSLQLDEIEELYTLRELLETYIVTPIMENIEEKDIQELEQLQGKIEAEIAKVPRNNKRIYELNEDFHLKMYAISKMPHLCSIIKDLLSALAFVRLFFAKNETYGETSLHEHRSYIEMLRNRDIKAMKKRRLANLLNHHHKMPELIKHYYKMLNQDDEQNSVTGLK
jgi:DNA-binding GntR family transcriptional regulator